MLVLLNFQPPTCVQQLDMDLKKFTTYYSFNMLPVQCLIYIHSLTLQRTYFKFAVGVCARARFYSVYFFYSSSIRMELFVVELHDYSKVSMEWRRSRRKNSNNSDTFSRYIVLCVHVEAFTRYQYTRSLVCLECSSAAAGLPVCVAYSNRILHLTTGQKIRKMSCPIWIYIVNGCAWFHYMYILHFFPRFAFTFCVEGSVNRTYKSVFMIFFCCKMLLFTLQPEFFFKL